MASFCQPASRKRASLQSMTSPELLALFVSVANPKK